MTASYDQKQLGALFVRVRKVLGPDECDAMSICKPRRDAFLYALSRSTKAVGGPENVTDDHIIGALEIAHEVFPVELETLSKALLGSEESDQ